MIVKTDGSFAAWSLVTSHGEVEVVCNGSGMEGPAAHGLLDYQITEVEQTTTEFLHDEQYILLMLQTGVLVSCYAVYQQNIGPYHITKLSPPQSHQHSLGQYYYCIDQIYPHLVKI